MENGPIESTIKTTKRYGFNKLNLLIALLSAFIIIVLATSAVFIFSFNKQEVILMSFLLLAFYAILMLFLAIRRTIKETNNTQTKIKFIEKIVEKPVIQRVVVHDTPKTKIITRTVTQKSKKLNIPQFKFIGSSVSKRFHTHACRLGKLIKRKFKVHHNTQSYFLKRKFKPCKVCILKTKKI